MADDDKENRTEAATPRRRTEAIEGGQNSKSADLTAAALLVGGLLTIHFMSRHVVKSLQAMMASLLLFERPGGTSTVLDDAFRVAGPALVRVVLPVMIAMAVISLVVTVGQTGGIRFTTKILTPDIMRLNPFKGMGRIFAGANVVQLAENLVKMTVVGLFAYYQFKKMLPAVLSLGAYEFPENMTIGWGLVYGLAIRMASILLILALLDWVYRKWKFERDIRMSKQDVKDESRRMEGDPEIKNRRRQLARKMMMQRIRSDVPKADVIITNPTELAIALKYDPDTMAAPRVVAKGAGFLAAQIRQIAVTHGVPIVERKPLAQAIYKGVEVGQEVPPQYYQAIAEILAYVFEMSGKGTRRGRAREMAGV